MSAVFSSQVLVYSYQTDAIARLNSSGVSIHAYLVGNGPISAAVYTTSSQIPLLSRESIIILRMLLALTDAFLLKRRG